MAKPRVVVNLVVSCIVALVAGFLVLKLLRGRHEAAIQAPPVAPETLVAVTVAPLARGARLDPDKIKLSPYFEQSIPEGAFRGLDELSGRIVSQPLAANEPVTKDKLFPVGVSGGIEATIPLGKRAMSVKGTPVLGLGGLIGPGAHIDVYGVFGITKDDKAAREIPVAKLLLQNIPVLAVGDDTEKGAGKSAAATGLYTLELTPDEAEKLALASDKGTLHFTLRNPTDGDVVFTRGEDLLRLLMSYLDYEPKAPEAPRGQAKPGGVVIIKGTKQTLVDGSTGSTGANGAQSGQGQAQAPPATAAPVPEQSPIPVPVPAPQRR
ncbi:MAG: Flp pilus assembly protein CpaB [Desulfovibrionaceae bacterium]|nr:Flp pilus assembly protein CpaB [Desulfovibrionaceae bacterium]MBF0512881.1 Flp pilus assembly protein CpaB [Desulfovibrionaceae bacterium]